MKIRTSIAGLRHMIREAKVQGVSEEQARKLMAKFPKGMAAVGVSPEQVGSLPKLGIGTRGVAFDLGDEKVLKITNDAAEAKASAILMGVDNPSLTRYFRVWEFGDSGVFGIVQEKLDPLSEEEGKMFNNALIKTRLPIWIAKSGYDFDKAKEMSRDFMKQDLKKKLSKGELTREQIPEWMEDVNKAWDLMSSDYNMRGLVKTLGEYGIKFHDYHAGNIMQRPDGTLVLIDIGLSKIQGDANIESIQEVMRIANSIAFLESL